MGSNREAAQTARCVWLDPLRFIIVAVFYLGMIFMARTAFAEGEARIRVMFTNDVHGHALPSRTDWGCARFATVVKQLGVDLLLDAGDMYHGMPFATLDSGGGMADVVRAVGYDAMTVGNHDWNYGRNQLLSLEARSGVPILCANVVDAVTGEAFFSKRYMVKVVNGLKVGIFGVIDPAIYRATAALLLSGLAYGDPVEAAREITEELRAIGCDIVICLTHTANRRQIADRVPGVDIVVTGHGHTLAMDSVNGVMVVESGYALRNICFIDIEFDPQTRRVLSVTPMAMTPQFFDEVEADERVSAVIAEASERFEPIVREVAGQTPVALDGKPSVIRSRETNLSRVVTDAYLYVTGAEIALENSAAMRATIPAGEITFGDIVSLAPFGNYLVIKRVSGQALLETMQRSADIFAQAMLALEKDDESLWPDNDGSGLHIAGMKVYFDMNLPEGSRVWKILVRGEPLVPRRMYTVAVSSFIAEYMEYPALVAAETVGEMFSCEEAIRRYIQERGVWNSLEGSRYIELEKGASTADSVGQVVFSTKQTDSLIDWTIFGETQTDSLLLFQSIPYLISGVSMNIAVTVLILAQIALTSN